VGVPIADCGLGESQAVFNPQSAISNPQFHDPPATASGSDFKRSSLNTEPIQGFYSVPIRRTRWTSFWIGVGAAVTAFVLGAALAAALVGLLVLLKVNGNGAVIIFVFGLLWFGFFFLSYPLQRRYARSFDLRRPRIRLAVAGTDSVKLLASTKPKPVKSRNVSRDALVNHLVLSGMTRWRRAVKFKLPRGRELRYSAAHHELRLDFPVIFPAGNDLFLVAVKVLNSHNPFRVPSTRSTNGTT
jgi:hypothetical protein